MIKQLISVFIDSSNSFDGQEKGEQVVLLLRRHYFTISIRIGLQILACLIPVVAGVAFWPYLVAHEWSNIFLFLSSIWYLCFWLIIFHTLAIYTLSTVIITDHRVIESQQHGLFSREISELHSDRIQDVSARTHGIIETFLEFGDVTVQTAASEKLFCFHQLPNPNDVKDVIMQVAAARHSGIKAT